jgi:hypothetical protein
MAASRFRVQSRLEASYGQLRNNEEADPFRESALVILAAGARFVRLQPQQPDS